MVGPDGSRARHPMPPRHVRQPRPRTHTDCGGGRRPRFAMTRRDALCRDAPAAWNKGTRAPARRLLAHAAQSAGPGGTVRLRQARLRLLRHFQDQELPLERLVISPDMNSTMPNTQFWIVITEAPCPPIVSTFGIRNPEYPPFSYEGVNGIDCSDLVSCHILAVPHWGRHSRLVADLEGEEFIQRFLIDRSLPSVIINIGETAYAHGSGRESLPPDVEVEVRRGSG